MTNRRPVAEELRDLAAWTDHSARILETVARRANDPDDPNRRTVIFDDAAALDGILTGLRRLPGLIQDIADRLESRPALKMIAGGRR
jgi:hypothetical protein